MEQIERARDVSCGMPRLTARAQLVVVGGAEIVESWPARTNGKTWACICVAGNDEHGHLGRQG